jgi:hypothetical protein
VTLTNSIELARTRNQTVALLRRTPLSRWIFKALIESRFYSGNLLEPFGKIAVLKGEGNRDDLEGA